MLNLSLKIMIISKLREPHTKSFPLQDIQDAPTSNSIKYFLKFSYAGVKWKLTENGMKFCYH